MTRRTLLRSVLTVMAFFAVLLALAIYAQVRGGTPGDPAAPFWAALRATIKDFTGLFIAIPGAWLAYCFSRRSAFLTILDGMWRGMVDAKGKCMLFTRESTPERFVAAREALSAVIDNMRSVYRNVGESGASIGMFPFQPLHDMRRALDRYGALLAEPRPAAEREALQAELREQLTFAWQGLRHRFLIEFGAPAPTAPIVVGGYRDPRRPPRAPAAAAKPHASSSTSQ